MKTTVEVRWGGRSLHKMKCKTINIGVESGVVVVSKFHSDINHVGLGNAMVLNVWVDGVDQSYVNHFFSCNLYRHTFIIFCDPYI